MESNWVFFNFLTLCLHTTNSLRPHFFRRGSSVQIYMRAPQVLSWAHPFSTQAGISQPATARAKCT
jgi:hypothetical protein